MPIESIDVFAIASTKHQLFEHTELKSQLVTIRVHYCIWGLCGETYRIRKVGGLSTKKPPLWEFFASAVNVETFRNGFLAAGLELGRPAKPVGQADDSSQHKLAIGC